MPDIKINHDKMKKTTKKTVGLTDEEIAAMKERIKELNADKADGEKAVLVRIAEMPESDRSMGKKLHAIIMANAPGLTPRTWYGMPAYSNEEGDVVLFFRGGYKFKERYMTLGFNNEVHLDEGHMWPIAFALKELTAADEAKIAALVKKAVS